MELTRRQLFASVLLGPIGAKLVVAAKSGQILAKTHTQGPYPLRDNILQCGVHLEGPLPKRYGGRDHLERIVLPGLITIRDLVQREAKGRPIRFLEPEMPKAIEYCHLYAIGPMRVREVWAWDPWPYDGSAPHFIGRLDAFVQIG